LSQFLSTIRVMRNNNSSVVDSCPPEIWTQIFYHACTDTGFTGRSVSATSRHFRELVKATKLRSIALFNIKQIAAFVKLVEALPCWERVVENLYLTTCGLPSPNPEAPDGAYLPANAQVQDVDQIYGPGSGVARPSTDDVLDNGKVLGHALTRILCATAPTLRHLHIFCPTTRNFLLPFVNLPHLQELMVEGPYNYDIYSDEDFANERLTAFRNLRRLRLTCVQTTDAVADNTLKAIVASAPNLTHLRLDHSHLYSLVVYNAIQSFLPPKPTDEFDPTSLNSAAHEEFSRGVTTLPRSLRTILLHPGALPQWGNRICGFAMGRRMAGRRALYDLASVDSRIILFETVPFTDEPAWKPQKGLDEWMDRISGGESYWSTCGTTK